MSPLGQIIWKHLHSARLTGNEDCTTREAMNAVEAAAREICKKNKCSEERYCRGCETLLRYCDGNICSDCANDATGFK